MFDRLIDFVIKFWDSMTAWAVIKEYEGGVVLRFGRYDRTLPPGLHWKIPLADYVITCHTAITTMDMRPQTLTTSDGKGVVVSAIVKYRVRGVKEFLLEIWDSADVLRDVTMGAVRDVINRTAYVDLCGNTAVESAVLEAVRKEVNQYGFQVYKVTFVDLGMVKSIRLLGATQAPTGAS